MYLHEKLRKIRLDYLNTFQILVQTKNFSESAKILGKSQGTISQQLKELEEAFGGISLIKRTSKTFNLTATGKIINNEIKNIIKNLNTISDSIKKLQGVESSKINIFSSSIPGEYILPSIFMTFQHQNPDFEFKISISNTNNAIENLFAGKVKFCAVGIISEENQKKVDSINIGSDIINIIAKINHPIFARLEKLKKPVNNNQLNTLLVEYPWIFRESGSATREWFINSVNFADKLNIGLEFQDNLAILNAIESSNALSAISSYMINSENKENRFRVIENNNIPEIGRDFYLVKLKDMHLNELEKKFWDFIEKISK
jgi:LysR family transcriptional regulator, transcriptional activator of the cysJI operon